MYLKTLTWHGVSDNVCNCELLKSKCLSTFNKLCHMYVSTAMDMKYFESQKGLYNYYKVCED